MATSWMFKILFASFIGAYAAFMIDGRYLKQKTKMRESRAHGVSFDGLFKRKSPVEALISKRQGRVSYSECQTEDNDKLDCGYYGIDQEECSSRGCCWKESNSPGAPWCFHSSAKALPQCTVMEQWERLECGYYGIKEHECVESNGCCWMPANDPKIPWCFSPGEGGPGGDCGAPQIAPRTAGRIVGGEGAIPHSWSWQVSLQNGDHFCGGSLISPKWVVTAAHCEPAFDWGDSKTVMVGMHNLLDETPVQRNINIEEIISHENYGEGSEGLDNDIMLLKLSEPVEFGEFISPVCLPKANFEVPDGTACYTTGWGALSSGGGAPEILQQVSVPIVSPSTCTQPDWYGSRVNSEVMICAGFEEGGKDSCQGDSGGPFVCYLEGQWELIGIVSWGEGCAWAKKPGIYTKTSHFVDWIDQKIAEYGED